MKRSALLVPDNLKSGITTPDLYEPLANETYREMAERYLFRSSGKPRFKDHASYCTS